MLKIIGFWATISNMSTLENTRFGYFFAGSAVVWNFSLHISRTVVNLTIPFSEKPQQDLSSALKKFAQTVNIFCCHQQKIQNMRYFWYFNDLNSGSMHDNWTNDTILLIYFFASIRWYISFLHFEEQGPAFTLCPDL